jgi:adenylate kinase family enzyme
VRRALTQRADDQPDTVKARLDTNRAWTEQLASTTAKQGKLHDIDGTGEPKRISRQRLLGAIAGDRQRVEGRRL